MKRKQIASLIILISILFTMVAGCSSSPTTSSTPQNQPNQIITTTESVAQPAQNTLKNELPIVNGQLKVSYIDVGQGDSILIQDGTHAMLIDAGTNAASSTVVGYIQQQGIKELEDVVGTHPHEDHIGGMDSVINTFAVDKVYLPKVTDNTATFKDLVLAMQNKGLKATSPVPGDTFELGDANCTILAPNSRTYTDLNNYSIVIKLTYGNTSFLFDGDAQAVSEEEMLAKGFDLSADVLKIGHHGSSSSTTTAFLNKVHPKYAVISVGKGNPYGHPTQQTMSSLQNNSIIVYRTDECGTIVATSDGKSITFNCNPGDYAYAGGNNVSTTSPNSSPGGTVTNTVPAVTNEQGNIVYVTASGTKYHRAGCRYLSKSCIPISLSDAIAQGYTACKVCNP